MAPRANWNGSDGRQWDRLVEQTALTRSTNPEEGQPMSTPRFILSLIVLLAVMAPSIYFGWRIWQIGVLQ